MNYDMFALVLVLLACIEQSWATCVVDSFTVKEDFDPKRVSSLSDTVQSYRTVCSCNIPTYKDTLQALLTSISLCCSMQGSGTLCRRRTLRASSFRTTSLLSTQSVTMAPWWPPQRAESLSLGKRCL